MKVETDTIELLKALKQAHLIAYDAYLRADPDGPEFDLAHQKMICTRRAYTNACVEFCDELVRDGITQT